MMRVCDILILRKSMHDFCDDMDARIKLLMNKVTKRIGAILCVATLLVAVCLPLSASALSVRDGIVRDRNGIIGDVKDGIKSAERDMRDAVDDIFHGRTPGTADDSRDTQRDTEGRTDDTDMATDGESDTDTVTEKATGTERVTEAESNNTGVDTKDESDGSKWGMGILIAVLVAAVIIILIVVAIPKNKGKPGSTGKMH